MLVSVYSCIVVVIVAVSEMIKTYQSPGPFILQGIVSDIQGNEVQVAGGRGPRGQGARPSHLKVITLIVTGDNERARHPGADTPDWLATRMRQ